MNDENSNHLKHYASPYYDPVKAHEYYMKHRKLKGRRPASKLSDTGKEVWSYTKERITAEKKSTIESETQSHKKRVEALRNNAKATKERISKKLKALNEALSKKVAADKKQLESKKKSDISRIDKNASKKKEDISSARETEIKRLMAEKIPKNLPKEYRAEKIAERNEKIAKIRSDAESETSKLSDRSKTEKEGIIGKTANLKNQITKNVQRERKTNSLTAAAERQKVSAELKSAIAAARTAYAAAKKKINSSYEEIYQQEYDKIASEMPKISKRKT